MTNIKKPSIIVIEGPSGVGKDTIIQQLIKREPHRFEKIVSVTDRPMRPNEIDGITYKYVTTSQFEQMIKTGEIFEFTRRHGTYRGMSKPLIDKILTNNKTAIKECDIIGVRALKKAYPGQVLTIFLTADIKKIEKRLSRRGDKDITTRLADYQNIHQYALEFDHKVTNNGKLIRAVDKIHKIINTYQQ